MKQSSTRSDLSKAGLVLAIGMLAYALYMIPADSILPDTLDAVAAATVSMSAGVQANPYNSAAEQIKAKEAQLAERENRLTMQETPSTRGGNDTLAVYSLLMSAALFILVGLNFFFDWRRGRAPVREGPATPYLSLDLRRKR